MSFILPNFHNMVKNQFNVTIKKFQSNNAIDCFNQVLTPFFQYEGIIHESSCVNTPQKNGVAKRKNGHLLDTTRAFLFQNHVLESCWEKVVLTATHLINQLPSRVLGFKSPMEVPSSFYPNMRPTNHLIPKIFGCVFFVHAHSPNRGKLDPRAVKCIFLGYFSTQKGYKCYHPPSKNFFVLVDVTSNERVLFSYSLSSGGKLQGKQGSGFLFH